MAPSYLNQLQ